MNSNVWMLRDFLETNTKMRRRQPGINEEANSSNHFLPYSICSGVWVWGVSRRILDIRFYGPPIGRLRRRCQDSISPVRFPVLFDQSCGHDRMPDDALRVDGMNKIWGWAKHHERKYYQGCTWLPWTTQSQSQAQCWQRSIHGLSFDSWRALLDDSRWTTANTERSLRNNSNKQTKEYTKPQLIRILQQEGIDNPAKGSRQQIKNMAEHAGLSLRYQKQDVVQGCEGKAKRIEQILWERGWIDPSQDQKSYTVNRKKVQWERSEKTQAFATSCQTSRTSRFNKQCFSSRQRRWAYS